MLNTRKILRRNLLTENLTYPFTKQKKTQAKKSSKSRLQPPKTGYMSR